MKYLSKLQGKRVLVLGGSSGIGFCVAEAAVEHGATVVVSSSRQTKVDGAIKRITSNYPDAEARISGFVCDLGNADTVETNVLNLYKFATNDGKDKLDHVVNTAGDSLTIPSFSDINVGHIAKATQVRWVGTIILGKFAPQYMNNSSASSFTATGGVNSYKPQPGWILQAGCGTGIEGIVRGLAVQIKPIRVNQVAPGAIVTELWENLPPEQLEKVKANYAKQTLVGHLGEPEDTAEAYLYLMKDKFMTGQTLITEGGTLLM